MACWQIKNNKVLCNIELEGEKLVFELPSKILPYIISHTPKMFYFNFYINDKKYTQIIDLQGIYIPQNQKKKLKIYFNAQQDRSIVFDKKYSIARGESFKDRYLTPYGWQVQEYFFPIHTEKNHKDNGIEKKEHLQPKSAKKQKENVGIYKECPHCGAILLSEYDYCPYCQKYISEIDSDADITI